MAILHYQVSRLDHSWLISCEAVPIDVFTARSNAVETVMRLAAEAKKRGDRVVLHIDHGRPQHDAAAEIASTDRPA